jgi:Fe-Mn family superoxide dismutase
MGKYILPTLKYQFADLEPYIDAKTVEIHYSKHHQTYTDKLNAALEAYPELQEKPIEELLRNLTAVPEAIRTAVRNHGGGYYNHNLYWKTMTPDGAQSESFTKLIAEQWGSWDKFKEEFVQKATTQFGSGWTWLVQDQSGKFAIIQMPNQDIPEGKHLVAIDVWEHAYYLKYQNKRADYIEAWWQIVDWKAVEENIKYPRPYGRGFTSLQTSFAQHLFSLAVLHIP